ncbi:MAG TPA: type II toxin-antitoxin system VapB family antitoxin [Gemmatimonadota bacterium]|nr:type II toxin-antitoxin system VapB family antitoxin [Gemmatimonadota bacterium]
MPLSIKNPEADELARELARETGESITDAVIGALRERLRKVRGARGPARLSDELRVIRERCATYPVLDDRPADEILGYGEAGVPD